MEKVPGLSHAEIYRYVDPGLFYNSQTIRLESTGLLVIIDFPVFKKTFLFVVFCKTVDGTVKSMHRGPAASGTDKRSGLVNYGWS